MVKKAVQSTVRNGTNFLFKQQKTILSGAAVIGVMLLGSAILGLVKKRLYASIITPSPELDAFFAAFRLPDLVFQLLVAGSLNAAFIPLFSEQIAKRSKKLAWEFASAVLNLAVLTFTALGLVIFFFARPLSALVASGFDANQTDLLVSLMRILALSPIFLGVSSFISGTIQSFRRFLIPFLSPIIYNLGAILGVLFLYPLWGLEGAAWGVVAGSVGHLLIQLPLLRHLEFNYTATLNIKDKLLRKMALLSIPRSIGLAAEQIKTLILVNLASLLPAGSISFFDLAQSIHNVPIGIFGVSIAQASLPALSELTAQKDLKKFQQTLLGGVNQILFLILPVSVVLIVLKIPVVRLVYGAGPQFTWTDTVVTSWVLAFFAMGMFAQAVNALLVRSFYALHETKIPVALGVVAMAVSLISAVGLVLLLPEQKVKGLALGVSIGAVLEMFLLAFLLHRRLEFNLAKLAKTPMKIFFSAAVMAISVYVPVQILDEVFIDTTRVVNLLILVWLVLSFGGVVYLLLNWFLGVEEIRIVFRLLWRLRNFKDESASPTQVPTPPPTDYLDESIE